MDNFDNENARTTAGSAEAENVKTAAAGTGKFKDVEALLNAYLSLEAEFTRRSQRLKELENESKARVNPESAPSPEGENIQPDATAVDPAVREAVIGDYLKSVAEGKSVPLVSGGVSAIAPKNAPKTVKEAGALAKAFLNKNQL